MNIRNGSESSRTAPDRPPERGRYAGQYLWDGKSLKRATDDLTLLIVDRGSQAGPHSSRKYLVNASSPTRDYVSNLYGNEFDDRVYRYRICFREDDPDTVDIVVLYPLREKGSRGRKRR